MKSDSENTLFKNILKLISGEGIGRAIGFVAAPIITRLYTTSDFGILAVFCIIMRSLLSLLHAPLHSCHTIAFQ